MTVDVDKFCSSLTGACVYKGPAFECDMHRRRA
jgi:hypothetical protein